MALTKYFQRTALTAALVAGAVTLAPASLGSTPIASAAPSSVRSYPATLLVGDDPLVPLALTALAQADIYGRTHSSATLLRMATARDAVATAIAAWLSIAVPEAPATSRVARYPGRIPSPCATEPTGIAQGAVRMGVVSSPSTSASASAVV